MKTEEDEAFDELARRQGAWGGGYRAKRAAAADKLQEPDALTIAYQSGFYDGKKAALAQPAQESVAHLWECLGKWSAYLVTNGKQADCAPPSWLVEAIQNATAPPKREWVGLTDAEIHGTPGYNETREMYLFALTLIAKLQEKNNGP